MKVLITGAAGQLGRDLIAACAATRDEVVACDRAALDVADREQVTAVISGERPDVIFNCAAWTAVDACEDDRERAQLINGTAVEFLGAAAELVGAHLVQVSTDYVFDGTKAGPYVEDDATNPTSVYGASKLAGERAALARGATVVRTSWVCSAHGGNMVATILRLAASNPTLRFVSDQVGHPTFTADLAPALRTLGADRVDGVVHCTNAGVVSWYEFAQHVLRAAGHDPSRVEPITTADLDPPRPAARPANSVLSNDRFAALGYQPLRHFTEPLAEVVDAYL